MHRESLGLRSIFNANPLFAQDRSCSKRFLRSGVSGVEHQTVKHVLREHGLLLATTQNRSKHHQWDNAVFTSSFHHRHHYGLTIIYPVIGSKSPALII